MTAPPVPTIDEVLARLRDGERIRAGGGRYSEEFRIEDGKLLMDVFDDGESRLVFATREELERALRHHPADFRK